MPIMTMDDDGGTDDDDDDGNDDDGDDDDDDNNYDWFALHTSICAKKANAK